MTNLLENRWVASAQIYSREPSWADEIFREFHQDEETWEGSEYGTLIGINLINYRGMLQKRLEESLSHLSEQIPDSHTQQPSSGESTTTSEDLRQRLANANDYFHRKATEVFNDESALDLLVTMHQDIVVDISTFDLCENGLPLAKLTAANFCEVGARVIYITEAGQQFIESLRSNERI